METAMERVVLGKVTRRLIPFMFLMYIFNFLDRTNVSVAALTMKADLRFSDAVYGLGAGIFFLGYLLFEVPSNLVLERVGARRWMARIMLTWGVISSGMMLVTSPNGFYTMRFLLGVAEAGFFPGMILYLSYWFPAAVRARAIARFMTAVPISVVLGGPLSAALLKMDGTGGLKGWQWLFLVEGLPSVLIGIVTLLVLTDRPAQAGWLRPEERSWLIERLRQEAQQEGHRSLPLWQAFAHPTILLLCALYFAIILCGYGQSFWSPLILQSRSSWDPPTISMLNSIPSLFAAVGMVVIAARSDRTGERRRHLAGALGLAACGFALGAAVRSPGLTLAAFSLVQLGIMGAMGPFWALCTHVTRGTSVAAGVAYISSVGNLGGFLGPTWMGALKGATAGFTVGLSTLAAGMLAAALLALALRGERVAERPAAAVPEGAAADPAA